MSPPPEDHLNHSRLQRVAVIGAGIAGAAAARTLADNGWSVTVFDKGRGPGGRTARRRTDDHHFDHGAQYFTARQSVFRSRVDAWLRDGVVAEWRGRVVRLGPDARHDAEPARRFVGVPGMSSLARHLGAGLDVRFGSRVVELTRAPDGWSPRLEAGGDDGPFDALVVTAPAPQTVELLRKPCPALADAAARARMQPCWSVMLGFDRRLEIDLDAAFVETHGPLRWIARNTSKPGRPPAESWVLNADHAWTIEHLEDPADVVAETLAASFFRALGVESITPSVRVAHRWRYALVDEPLGTPCLFDARLGVAACGDWCLGPRIECAFLSGVAAAERVAGISASTVPERR